MSSNGETICGDLEEIKSAVKAFEEKRPDFETDASFRAPRGGSCLRRRP